METPGNPYHDPNTGRFTTGGGPKFTGPHPDAPVHFEHGSVKLIQTPGKRNVKYQLWDGETLVHEIPATTKCSIAQRHSGATNPYGR